MLQDEWCLTMGAVCLLFFFRLRKVCTKFFLFSFLEKRTQSLLTQAIKTRNCYSSSKMLSSVSLLLFQVATVSCCQRWKSRLMGVAEDGLLNSLKHSMDSIVVLSNQQLTDCVPV